MNFSIKRRREDPCSSSKKKKVAVFTTKHKAAAALVDLIQLVGEDESGFGHGLGPNSVSAVLEPGRVYTVGRSNRGAEFIFDDPRVSKQHCQLLFDGFLKKLYLLNGAIVIASSANCSYCSDNSFDDYGYCIVNEFRSRLIVKDKFVEEKGKSISCSNCRYVYKGALNGVFVNGVRVGEGLAVELGVGDEVLLVCGNRTGVCGGSKLRIGFVVRTLVFHEELVDPCFDGVRFERPRLVRPLLGGKVSRRIFALRVSDSEFLRSKCDEVVGRAKSLLVHCKHIVRSHDPVSHIRQFLSTHSNSGGLYFCESKEDKVVSFELNGNVKTMRKPQINVEVSRKQSNETLVVKDTEGLKAATVESANAAFSFQAVAPLEPKNANLYSEGGAAGVFGSTYNHKATNHSESNYLDGRNESLHEAVGQKEFIKKITPPGKNFYLNRLDNMHQGSSGHGNVVTLPELLHPVDSISRMFIATFTSDIGWFLSYCGIPSHLPVTIACHNTERCWSADPGKRTCVPDADFPNLVVVYPPFPEVIAFGKDRKNKGVGCHHPKLLVVQRENCMRVVITSANLVAKQWKNATNTVWWQDFPCRTTPDCSSLFNQFNADTLKDTSTSDFAAQLAGFMASLVTDVPSQAYWIVELTKYDFSEANVHLIASVPGIHSYRSTSTSLLDFKYKSRGRFLGCVEASVVGLSHRFRRAADSKGIELKKLAGYLGRSSEKGSRMSEIILKRETNVPQDANAVSVFLSNPNNDGDCVQLGFLPRTVAKWVSPLWDVGFCTFHGYVYPREVLAAASGESNLKVELILHLSQGPNAQDITKMMGTELVVAFCSLIASLQRCTGLWRLEEVLQQYKWPEYLETDFIYGASSIGTSVSAQFLAAFAAAAGKRSQQGYDSDESDPEWGRWNADHEMKCPSMRIIFPTIERVKSSHCGIFPSKHLLCFAEKTWQRLKTADILHDAVPHPDIRAGHPMHVKVARRCFKSKKEASSYGWIYCGSHNMSAVAWGQHVSSQSGGQVYGREKRSSSGLRLRVCNYELGCIFVFPPPTKDSCLDSAPNLDDISLPFVVPAPKYGPRDRPATKRAMSEAVAEFVAHEGMISADLAVADEEMVDEDLDDKDEVEIEVEASNYVEQEAEEEKAYADVLWHHVDSSQSF